MQSLEHEYIAEVKPQRNILLVDDEENITRSLVRLLRQDGYNIYTAKSGEDGLSILKDIPIGVILSDQRMPEMCGTEFLRKVRDLYPETIRIVLSGYTDLKTVTDAINEGEIYKFLTKPWDDSWLRANVAEAFKQYELEKENEMLWSRLEKANNELREANIKLEMNVNQQARSAQVNMLSLQVSQDVLQNAPMAVLGVDSNEMVVFANAKAHELFVFVGVSLIGESFSNVVPEDIVELCMGDNTADFVRRVRVGEGKVYDLFIERKGTRSLSSGLILVFVPVQEG